MFPKLVIATGNRGKYQEFCEIIANDGENFADDIIFAPEISRLIVEESGHSYAENSLLKARAWSKKSGLPCIADDSGLEVDALGGEPGIFSARAAKEKGLKESEWILSRLEGIENRKARFVSSVCLCVPEKFTLITEGYCYGKIAKNARGFNGFGYDPVFLPDGYSETFAELPGSVKNNISHRTDAIRKILSLVQ